MICVFFAFLHENGFEPHLGYQGLPFGGLGFRSNRRAVRTLRAFIRATL